MNWALMKMEPKTEDSQPPLPQIPVIKGNKTPEARNISAKTWRSSSASNNRYLKNPASVKTYEMPLQPYVSTSIIEHLFFIHTFELSYFQSNSIIWSQ